MREAKAAAATGIAIRPPVIGRKAQASGPWAAHIGSGKRPHRTFCDKASISRLCAHRAASRGRDHSCRIEPQEPTMATGDRHSSTQGLQTWRSSPSLPPCHRRRCRHVPAIPDVQAPIALPGCGADGRRCQEADREASLGRFLSAEQSGGYGDPGRANHTLSIARRHCLYGWQSVRWRRTTRG